MRKFVEGSSDSARLPGPYPDFLSTGTPKPAVHRDLIYEVYPYLVATLGTLTALKRGRGWLKFWTDIVQSNDGLTRNMFDGIYMASAVLCLAQKICATQVSVGISRGDFSSLVNATLEVFAPVRKIADQYGSFTDARTGEILTPVEYDGLICRLIYLAEKIYDNGENGNPFDLDFAQTVGQKFFIPIRAGDESVDADLRHLLNQHVNSSGNDVSVNFTGEFFAGNADSAGPGWLTSLVPAAEGGNPPLNRLFQSRPNIAQWMEGPMTAALTLLIPDYGGGPFAGIQPGDMAPAPWNHKPVPAKISNRLSQVLLAVKNDIVTINNLAVRETTGVWSQMGRTIFDPEDALATARLPFGTSAREAAMALLYPACVNRLPISRDFVSGMSADARFTINDDLQRLKDDFVWSHLSGPYG